MDGLLKRGQSANCVHGLCCSPAHPSLGCESCMLQSRVWNADPGRGQLLSLKRQPVGKGVMGSKTGKVCGKCPRHHRSKASLLSGTQGAGLPLQPPFVPAGLCLCRHWKGQPSEQACPPLKPRPPLPRQALGSEAVPLSKPPWVLLPETRIHQF